MIRITLPQDARYYPDDSRFFVGGVFFKDFLHVHPENWGFMIQFDVGIFFR